MKDQQKFELETLIRSLTNTLDKVADDPESRINIHDIRQEEIRLIVSLLVNYVKKQQKK